MGWRRVGGRAAVSARDADACRGALSAEARGAGGEAEPRSGGAQCHACVARRGAGGARGCGGAGLAAGDGEAARGDRVQQDGDVRRHRAPRGGARGALRAGAGGDDRPAHRHHRVARLHDGDEQLPLQLDRQKERRRRVRRRGDHARGGRGARACRRSEEPRARQGCWRGEGGGEAPQRRARAGQDAHHQGARRRRHHQVSRHQAGGRDQALGRVRRARQIRSARLVRVGLGPLCRRRRCLRRHPRRRGCRRARARTRRRHGRRKGS
mmetsp:Transcript_2297/g.8394  ORF Transcript_2297/g.8394 Transcript_2297/m.8394 type:complete len:267 (+) Transcript_2297:249-1049(+)